MKMRWIKPNLRSSLYSLLGAAPEPSESRLEDATEEIRDAMLAALGPDGPTRMPNTVRKIRYAVDIQALWYLRGELMAGLSATQGESVASQQVTQLSQMFRGLLPAGLGSRPSPLGD